MEGCKALTIQILMRQPAREYNEGQLHVPLAFAGVNIEPGQYVYADENGIVVANSVLERTP